MKNILLTLAICLLAVSAQAAAVDWSAAKVVDPWSSATAGNVTSAKSWAGYLVLATDLDTIVSGLKGNDTSALVNNAISSKTSTNIGAFNNSTAAGNVTGGSQDFYLIIINAGQITDASYFYVSDKVTVNVDASLDTKIAFGSQQTGTSAVSNWTAVPEPTSGLLILLGMAGLALRRRA